MPKKPRVTKTWEVGSETLDLGRGRYGYTDLIRTTAPAWDWFAEGGKLGPIEGTANTREEARERVEQALGLRTAGGYVKRLVTYRDAREARVSRTR